LYNHREHNNGHSAPPGIPALRGGSSIPRGGKEYALSLADLLRIIRQWLWVILLVAAVLAGAAVGFSLAQTPIYEASIRIMVGQERGTNDLPIGVYDLQALTQTMAESVSIRPVAEAVIRQQNLRETPEELLANLSVEQVATTQLIQVSYTDLSPERAQRVANAIGSAFSERVSKVTPSAIAITATVWEPAVVPDEPVSPNPLRNGLLALVLGLMLGVGLAFLLESLDDSWRSPEEVEQVSGVPTYGVIPNFELSKSKKARY